MNFRLLLCIVMGVFVAHLGVFMFMAELQPKPKLTPPPKRNFSAKATVVVNAETGEKTIYREITVSTKFSADASTPPPQEPILTSVKPVESAVKAE
jgi:hypothetical protein